METRAYRQILVVDDDPVSLLIITEHLAAEGFEPLAARDAMAGIALLERHRPRLIVSDWNMPGMGGLEFCCQVRAQYPQEYVYFMMLTVESDKDRLIEAFKTGVDDFITKPFHKGELLARIRAGMRMLNVYDELLARTACSQQLNAELVRLNTRLQQAATTDELTGLFNRRQGMLRLHEQWELARRYSTDFACAMIDVDHFKAVNDAYGHIRGDQCLHKVASVLAGGARSTDIVCRIGGEEFLMLFPSQTASQALPGLERCRQAVAGEVFADPSRAMPITISVGLSEFSPNITTSDGVLRLADECLYAAKRQGRNRIVVWNARPNAVGA